jgi:hypothetical protein
MPTSPDGVLTAEFDPDRALVTLLTDGAAWGEDPPDRVTLLRAVGDETPVVVRGADQALAPGGVLLWSDNEAPLDQVVTYTAQAETFDGTLTSSVDVATTGAVWGMWVKVPGQPELTTRAPLAGLGDFSRETLGGSWQIPNGPTISQSGSGALAQSAGMGALGTQVTLQTRSMGDLAALERAVRQAPGQVLLIQTGEPQDLPSGYYQVTSMVRQNPAGIRPDVVPLRRLVLAVTESAVPAGPASGWSGTTYGDVVAAFATYQDLADADLTYLDVATGGWS